MPKTRRQRIKARLRNTAEYFNDLFRAFPCKIIHYKKLDNDPLIIYQFKRSNGSVYYGAMKKQLKIGDQVKLKYRLRNSGYLSPVSIIPLIKVHS